ncbi:ATP-binding protein [Anabaena sp. UHCC 0187]|uniref:P-loop NTPase fold protein n=1 Tax=Anabaena sp. UHCC 0187 TaxID=2590018 RepID=UPI001444BF92|nr:P-loop NTPase fold protein [Anabaena sp. UHCC 0187]MTJ12789.1 ATP-binding protein [Anabaena sp. UHCC 0187]
MTNISVSPIEAVNAAIQSHNPFTNAGITKEQDVWGKGFPDVPTLNAQVSDKVFQAIELVRTSQSSQEKVTSITITAQKGVGKTHLLSRIRHRLEREGGALFVYASVNNYTDLSLVKYQFQQTLADSLSKTGSQGVMQWQEVAAAIANEGFKAISTNAPNLSAQDLLERFDKVCISWSAKNKNLMDRLIKEVLKTKLNADPYIVRAILWTLSETQATFAIKWLRGEELAKSNADVLGLPNPSKTNQDREAEALKNIQQILNLVSQYNSIVICFDEIDVKNNCTDNGLSTEIVIANLVKILHDTLENSELGKGIVILTVMLPETWKDKILEIPGGTPDRLSKYTGRKPIDLRNIDGDSLVELVTLWLKDFYEIRNLLPPQKTYPFEEINLREYAKKRPTVREALSWCAENFKVEVKVNDSILPKEPLKRFEIALKIESEADIGDYLDEKNNSIIADALRFCFQSLKGYKLEGETPTGEKLEQVIIEDITEIEPQSINQGWINFKLVGKEKDKLFKIGVAVLQHSNGRTVGAGMWRLIDYERFDLTRGCLVRSKEKKIRKAWDSYTYLNKLVKEYGGEWVSLNKDEIRPLIDIYSVYQKRDSYQLNEEQVLEYAQSLTRINPLLLEILSDPSGQIDEETLEGEELLNDFSKNPSLTEEIDDTDDLSELFN